MLNLRTLKTWRGNEIFCVGLSNFALLSLKGVHQTPAGGGAEAPGDVTRAAAP